MLNVCLFPLPFMGEGCRAKRGRVRAVNSRLKKLTRDLLSLPTAPFHEEVVLAYIREFARRRALDLKSDRYGNLIVRYRNGNRPKPVALSAHTDHPGFEILDVCGRDIRARWLGGCDPNHFPGGAVTIISVGEEIAGRATSPLARDKTFAVRSRRALPNANGFGYWRLKSVDFDGDQIKTKAADNLAGCVAILATLDRLQQRGEAADLRAVFTRAEEVGLLGAGGIVEAKTLPKRVPLIVLEASKELPGAKIRDGPVVRVGDAMTVFDPKIEFALHTKAANLQRAKRRFRYQRQLMSGGVCEVTLYALHDLPVGALAFPLGNYHNQGKRWPAQEVISASDLAGMIELCFAIAVDPPSGKAWRPIAKRFSSAFNKQKRRLMRT